MRGSMRTQDEKVDVRGGATMGLKCPQGRVLEGGIWLLVLDAVDKIFTGLRAHAGVTTFEVG